MREMAELDFSFTKCNDKMESVCKKEEMENTNLAVQNDTLDLKGKRLLVVDDVNTNREILCLMLEDTGAALDQATNGEEAVRLFSQNKYDLVLMDLHMPVMNGYNASKNIRSLPLLWAVSTPIISVSAESSIELHARCKEVGMNDHIAKPVDREDLFKKITKWIPA